MSITAARMAGAALCAAVLLTVAGCGGNAGTSGPSTSATVAIPGGALSRAQFITAADGLCAQTTARQAAVVAPQNEDDFPALIAEANFFLANAEPFYDQLDALATRSPDAAQLRTNWLTPARANVVSATPIFEKLRTAAREADPQQVRIYTKQLSDLPTQGANLARYLNGYGLRDCATLEAT